MSYEPLAIRYRPKKLEELVGQEGIVRQLRGMFKGSISRSFLISGAHGNGKTSTARIIARYVNCLAPVDGEPCEKCKSCQRFAKGNHPDLNEINAADSRGIDDIRAIISTANYTPQTKYRVYILDEVHQLTQQAMSSLLKILEEPPARTIFCLCTTNPEKLLDTIRSRCQILNIQQIKLEECVALLKKVAEAEGQLAVRDNEEVLCQIAELVRGHPRDALQALEAVINAMKGGELPTENLQEFIGAVAKDVLYVASLDSVANYLGAIYTNRYPTALKIAHYLDNPEYFIRLCIDAHTQVLFRATSKKLMDSYAYKDFFELLDKVKVSIGKSVASEMLVLLVNYASQTKQYLVDAHHLMYALTAQLMGISEKAIASGEITFDKEFFKKKS